jgi:rhodanese-related sulfurtransferase
MLAAVGVYAIAIRVAMRQARPRYADGFALPTRRDIDPPLLSGAAIFGVGWGVAGLCPGPAVTALGSGSPVVWWFVLAMLGGMVLAGQPATRQALGAVASGLAVVAVAMFTVAPAADVATPIAPTELLVWEAAHAPLVVDVRSPEEFAAGHIPGARNVPVDELPTRVEEIRNQAGGREVVLYCQSGRRAARAAQALHEQGVGPLRHLTGDYQGWAEAGRPVARGTAAR